MVGQWKLEFSVMSTPVQPLTWLVVAIAGWIQRDQRTAIVAGRDGDRDAANRSRGQSKDAENLLMDNHFIQGADWSSRPIVRILDRA